MDLNCNSSSKCSTNTNQCCHQSGGTGYAFVLVLFILIVLVGAAWLN